MCMGVCVCVCVSVCACQRVRAREAGARPAASGKPALAALNGGRRMSLALTAPSLTAVTRRTCHTHQSCWLN